MKEGWEYKKFGEVCWYNKNNGLHKSTRYVGMEHIEQGTGRLLCTISSDDVLSNTFAFNKGDVLYGRLRPYLKKVIVADFDGCCSTELFPIQSKDIIAPFLKYWFLTDEITNKINATCAGCRMPRGNMNDVLKFDISYPSISEQQSIVDYLDSAFAKIDSMKTNAEKALNEAKALFQASLKEILEPKEGWEEKKMSELYDVRDGTHDSPKYQETGYPLVTSKNLRGGILDMSNVNFISEEDYNAINNRSKVDIGDVLFAMIGTIGNPVYVQKVPNYAIKNMALFKVPSNQSGEFLRYYLLNDDVLCKMQNDSKGTTQKFVSLGYLRNFLVKIPSLSEQQSIVATLDSLKSKVDRLQENYDKISQECDALKQAILRQVFE